MLLALLIRANSFARLQRFEDAIADWTGQQRRVRPRDARERQLGRADVQLPPPRGQAGPDRTGCRSAATGCSGSTSGRRGCRRRWPRCWRSWSTYELGRRMFGAATASLGGVAVAGVVRRARRGPLRQPQRAAGRLLQPDAGAVLARLAGGRRGWLGGVGVAAGLAVLAKGPIGLLAPAGIVVAFLAWQRQLWRLLDWRQLEAALTFLLVAAPWYVWVAVETRGRGSPASGQAPRRAGDDGDGEPLRPALLLPDRAAGRPGAVVDLSSATLVHAWKRLREASEDRAAVRFLLVWAGSFLLFFSLSCGPSCPTTSCRPTRRRAADARHDAGGAGGAAEWQVPAWWPWGSIACAGAWRAVAVVRPASGRRRHRGAAPPDAILPRAGRLGLAGSVLRRWPPRPAAGSSGAAGGGRAVERWPPPASPWWR